MFGETAEGWLSKTGLLGRQRRYFVLAGNELRYYKQMSDTRPAGTIELKHYSIAERDGNKQYPYGIRIASQCKYHRSYIFYADHEQGCQYWIDVINATLNPFIGRYHTCDGPVSTAQEESYSVLDKWLNRLDLNDDRQYQRQQQAQLRTSALESSPTTNSPTTTNTLLSYLSPTLRASRGSLESLDSLPSETTLSSSAGSRAHSSMAQNTILIPHHHQNNNNSNCNSSQSSSHHHHPTLSPPTQYESSTNSLNSNPVSFVSRSLSNMKKQHSLRHNQQSYGDNPKSPTWSFDSMTTSSTANSNYPIKTPTVASRKDWESDDLFDFEDEMDPSKLFRGTGASPLPNASAPQVHNRCLD